MRLAHALATALLVFHVKDKAQLDAIKDGDKVRFRVVSAEGGRMTITEIEPAR